MSPATTTPCTRDRGPACTCRPIRRLPPRRHLRPRGGRDAHGNRQASATVPGAARGPSTTETCREESGLSTAGVCSRVLRGRRASSVRSPNGPRPRARTSGAGKSAASRRAAATVCCSADHDARHTVAAGGGGRRPAVPGAPAGYSTPGRRSPSASGRSRPARVCRPSDGRLESAGALNGRTTVVAALGPGTAAGASPCRAARYRPWPRGEAEAARGLVQQSRRSCPRRSYQPAGCRGTGGPAGRRRARLDGRTPGAALLNGARTAHPRAAGSQDAPAPLLAGRCGPGAFEAVRRPLHVRPPGAPPLPPHPAGLGPPARSAAAEPVLAAARRQTASWCRVPCPGS